MRVLRRVTRYFLTFVLLLVVLAGVTLAFSHTGPGRRTLANLLETVGGAQVEGTVHVGEVKGSILGKLRLIDVRIVDQSGNTALEIPNVRLNYRVADLFPPKVVVEELLLEQPRVKATIDEEGRSSLSNLFGFVEREAPSQKVGAEKAGEPAVRIERVEVIGGRFEQEGGRFESVLLERVDANVESLEELLRSPRAKLSIKGEVAGLPLFLEARSDRQRKEGAPVLSAVGKQKNGTPSVIELDARLGRSTLSASTTGSLRPDDWRYSNFTFRVNRLFYESEELRSLFPALPARDLIAQAQGEVAGELVRAELEIESEAGGKVILQAHATKVFTEKGQLRPPTQLVLEKLRIEGKEKDRPVLIELSDTATLRFDEGDPFPKGRLALRGRMGEFQYARPDESILVSISKFRPAMLLQALALQPAADQYGTFSLTLRLPEGPHSLRAATSARWVMPVSIATGQTEAAIVTLNARARNGGLAARIEARAVEETVHARLNLEKFFGARLWDVRPREATGTVRVATRDFDLARLSMLLPGEFDPLNGIVTTRVQLAGSYANAKLDMDAVGRNVGFPEQARRETRPERGLFNFGLNLTYDSRLADLKGTVRPVIEKGKAAPLRFRGRFQLPQRELLAQGTSVVLNAPMTWEAESRGFQLWKILAPEGTLPENARDIRLDLEAHGEGTLRKPRGTGGVTVRTREGLFAKLSASLRDESLEARLISDNASSDSVAAIFSEDVRTEGGVLNADFRVSGSTQALTYSGYFRWKAERLRFQEIATDYRNVELALHGNEKLIMLERLKMGSGKGTFNAVGRLALEAGKESEAVKLRAKLKDFEVFGNDDVRLETSGALSIVANRADATFRGEFTVDDGTIMLVKKSGKENLEPLTDLEDVVYLTPEEHEPQPGLFDRLRGAIAIHIPGRVFVKQGSDDLNVEVAGDVEFGLRTNEKNPRESELFLVGELGVQRGFAQFFGRMFTINRGVVNFLGDPEEPRITALAEYRASPRNILVEARGPVENLDLRFSSDPAGYSNDEAIGVLVTGSPDFRGQGGRTSIPERGIGLIAGFLSGIAKDELAKALPIDTFTADFETESGPGGSQGTLTRTQIEMGKYLSDRLFVKFGSSYGAAEQELINKITLDYSLNEKWSIRTVQTDRGRSELELQWTLNY